MTKILLIENKFSTDIISRYDKDIVKILQKVNGAIFNRDKKYWQISNNLIDNLIFEFHENKVEFMICKFTPSKEQSVSVKKLPKINIKLVKIDDDYNIPLPIHKYIWKKLMDKNKNNSLCSIGKEFYTVNQLQFKEFELFCKDNNFVIEY